MGLTVCGILGHARHLHQELVRTGLGDGYDVLDELWDVVAVDLDNQGFGGGWG